MEKYISVIIPNYNKSTTIERCLEAAFSSQYENFEVIVVDDCSTDNSVEVIKRFPCRLIQLDEHSGTSKARNTGANNSNGEVLFFIDSDCLMQKNTLSMVNKAMIEYGDDHTVIGGTYTMIPFDDTFFSTFQSIFVNYFETKKIEPDYTATHAMAISAHSFRNSGGFQEQFLPMLEDVEFSHRLRKAGCKLAMHPEILVQHIFNFSLLESLRNALKKSMYWTIYSIKNRDLLADSGTASIELKINGAAYLLSIFIALLSLAFANLTFLLLIPVVFIINLFINRKLLATFYKIKALPFAIPATLYYTALFPAAVWAGAIVGAIKCFSSYKVQRNYT